MSGPLCTHTATGDEWPYLTSTDVSEHICALSSPEDYFSNFINSGLYSWAADSDHCLGPGHPHLHRHPAFVQTPESRHLSQTTTSPFAPKRLLIPALCFVK